MYNKFTGRSSTLAFFLQYTIVYIFEINVITFQSMCAR